MGLDMYLFASRRLTPDEADSVTARLTPNELGWLNDPEDGTAYLSAWPFADAEYRSRTLAVIADLGLTPLLTEDSPALHLRREPDGSLTADLTCVYWRKANAVHGWIVTKVADGVDECQRIPINVETLAHLVKCCNTALEAYEAGDRVATAAAMPPTSGFFFGSTDLDEWWAENMRRTSTEVEKAVRAAIAIGGLEFVYQASW